MPFAADTPIWDHMATYGGRAPRMVMLDRADKVAEAIVWASVHPREELPVGWKAQGVVSSHDLFPDLTERIAADVYHDIQTRDAPAAADAPGNLYRPVERGRGVGGGIGERMEAEERAREGRPSAPR